ncbi:bacteriohemerythrin [Pseudothauera nasutitermitis]|uniref:Bacteriohemerythrin n=1 Tax=Pseudothauera nasutitermitis TaxID=2565930 RepID=A0A4S4B208_9RHOO|nr:bacteriohemerythrin [Pseudothauera nasutitermitis]THF66624.1 bacteriohemerythrin [Pseudothauera nasutitermitis]
MAGKDSLVAWDESYSLGLEEIDDQHKVLFDIMNHLWSAIVRRTDSSEMLRILAELERYTVTHFSAEEAYMQSTGYAGLAAHRAQHEQFVARVNAARADIQQGKQISLELLQFLRDWLVRHIQVEDRAYAQACARSTQGRGLLGRFFGRLMRSA